MVNLIRGVLYLEKDRFQLAIDNRADVVVYTFLPTLVNNFDILDAESLKQSISDFLTQNNVLFSDLVIVVSSAVTFEKEFKKEEEGLIDAYIENVPYETITSKKIATQNGTKVLVGNAAFYSLLAETFFQKGIKLDYVIPEIALGSPIGAFSTSTARLILTRFDALAQFKFMLDDTVEIKMMEKKVHEIKEKKKQSVLVLILPVIGIILVVLIFFIVQPILFKKKSTISRVAVPTMAPAPLVVPTEEVTSAPTQLKQPRTVQILFDTSETNQADQLKNIFSQLGFTSIQSAASSTTVSTPIVIFQQGIDPQAKQKILDEIKKVVPNVVTQDSPSSSVDISITLGKSL